MHNVNWHMAGTRLVVEIDLGEDAMKGSLANLKGGRILATTNGPVVVGPSRIGARLALTVITLPTLPVSRRITRSFPQ